MHSDLGRFTYTFCPVAQDAPRLLIIRLLQHAPTCGIRGETTECRNRSWDAGEAKWWGCAAIAPNLRSGWAFRSYRMRQSHIARRSVGTPRRRRSQYLVACRSTRIIRPRLSPDTCFFLPPILGTEHKHCGETLTTSWLLQGGVVVTVSAPRAPDGHQLQMPYPLQLPGALAHRPVILAYSPALTIDSTNVCSTAL